MQSELKLNLLVFVIDAPEDIAFPRSILKNRRPSEPMQTEAKFAMKSIRKTANSRSEPQAMIGTLIATINSARNVRRGTSTGKQEPYCVVRLGQERQTTDKDRRGEQTPQWYARLNIEALVFC